MAEKGAKLTERALYAEICRHDGAKARELAAALGSDHGTVNRLLSRSPLLRELCWQDGDFRWHGLVRQTRPHTGLGNYCGYYGSVGDFLALSDEEWLEALLAGCRSVARNLNDTRGLLHSFRDCRKVMVSLFADLKGVYRSDWEIAFELRLKKSRTVRLYSDVLVITENRVFAPEFKMKDVIDPAELRQSAKYAAYLEVLFGDGYDVIPALVLSRAADLYRFEPLDGTDAVIPVCSGDMLFNVFDEYLGFLKD